MTPAESDSPSQRDLADYLAVLRRRKWVIVQSVAIVALVAFFLSVRQEKVFESSADVLLSRQNISNVITGVTNPDVFGDPQRFMETQAGLARAPEVARLALETAGLDDRTPGQLLARSSVQPKTNADLLRFVVDDASPATATLLANAYAKAFTSYKAQLDTGEITRARKDLDQRLAELGRAGKAGSDSYLELAKNAQQLRTMELLQQRNVIARPASGAAQTAPTPKRNALLGAFLGLLLGLGVAALWEALDKRVRKEEEIEQLLGLTLVGQLPAPPARSRVTMVDDPQSSHAEAVRQLRTNLEFANVDRGAKVIMVTSAVEQEGKSTTAANLAVALARSGKNVVLVDLDLRHPSIADVFKVEPRPGITEVVLGRVDLQRAVVSIPLPVPVTVSAAGRSLAASGRPVHVLSSGALPANPGEFVATQALAHVLNQLRGEFDYVIVDSAPLLAVGDSLALSAGVDGILVISRLGVVDRRILHALKRTIDASPAPKIGLVVTGVTPHDAYGYGYGHKHEQLRDTPVREVSTTVVDGNGTRRRRGAAAR